MIGIYTIDVSMMSAESKENSNSWMWVCFDHKSCVLSQKKLCVFCLAQKVTGQPIQYFSFALPKTFLAGFFVLILYLVIISLVYLFVEIMFIQYKDRV